MPEFIASLVHWNGINHLISDVDGGLFSIYSLIISVRYNDTPSILCGTGPGAGRLYEWDPPAGWVIAATEWINGPVDSEKIINSLVVLNGQIYGNGSTTGRLFICPVVRGNPWVPVTPYSVLTSGGGNIIVFHSQIYIGGGNDGKLRRWNGVNNWVVVADTPPGAFNIPQLIVFNGQIYGAGGQFLYAWNGIDRWVQVTTVPVGILTMAINNGSLFGTDGFGNLYKLTLPTSVVSNNVKKKLFVSGAI